MWIISLISLVALVCVMFVFTKALKNNRITNIDTLETKAEEVAFEILSAYRLEKNQIWTVDGRMVRFKIDVLNPFSSSRKITAQVAVSMHLTTVFFRSSGKLSKPESLWLAMVASALSQKGASVAWPKHDNSQPLLPFLSRIEYVPSK